MINGAMRNSCIAQLDEEETGEESENTEQYLDEESVTGIEGATPIPKRHRVTRDAGLAVSLSFGHYPEFLGMHGPSQDPNPKNCTPFSLSIWTLL